VIFITKLVDANLVLKCYNINKPAKPLKSYSNHEIFKTYLHDIGLLGAMSQLNAKVLLEGDLLFQEYKGALTENFVAQSLTNTLDHPLFYWTSEGKAEVDFVADIDGDNLPLEVKAGSTKKKKSLTTYQEKYKPKRGIRLSPMNIARDGELINIPLYGIDELTRLLAN
tara:strand:- start:8496 stop:8999 length:504 start_codon:yes stop_codon:yes gene_type:complete